MSFPAAQMATQTSYSRSLQEHHQVSAVRNKLSVLAQARPVIVGAREASSSPFGDDDDAALQKTSESLSEKMHATLRLASHHIEDETLIEKQNAANQMRQAAIASAAANQQRQAQSKRLSATERLALTAKRPPEQAGAPADKPQQATGDIQKPLAQVPLGPPLPLHQRSQSQVVSRTQPALAASSLSSSKLAPMPTLETLLAVQRQLQRHTRQNLTPTQEPPLKEEAKEDDSRHKPSRETSERQQFPNLTKLSNFRQQEQNNHYVTAAPRPQTQQQQQALEARATVQQAQHQPLPETYDKELPPLPASVSPSSYGATSSDDSQLNSLDSQSSPATSLVSLPPPPPPLSAYLQQYDEAASSIGDSSNHSRSSTSPPASAAEMHQHHQHHHHQHHHQQQHPAPPPLKSQFAQIPLKQHAPHQQPASQLAARRVAPAPQVAPANKAPPPLAPRPAHLAKSFSQPAPTLAPPTQLTAIQSFAHPPPPPAPLLAGANGYSTEQNLLQTTRHQSAATSEHEQHVNSSATQSKNAASFEPLPPLPPPPPPPPIDSQPNDERPQLERQAAFDEPDCVAATTTGAFRFPTPPPPELSLFCEQDEDDEDLELLKKKLLAANDQLLAESDEDSDFQCRIPTPPPGHQSAASSASFADFHRQDLGAQSALSSQFCASVASAARQNQQQQHQLFVDQQRRHQFSFQRSSSASAASQGANQQLRSTCSFSPSAVGGNFPIQPPALFQHQHQQQAAADDLIKPPSEPQLTVRVQSSDDEAPGRLPSGGLLTTKQKGAASGLALLASSSSPSCSSDGDGQSSNSSSSTSGVHSSIESPLSDSASRLSSARELNFAKAKLASRKLLAGATSCGPLANADASGLTTIKRKQSAANLKDFLIQRPVAPFISSASCLKQNGAELARRPAQVQRQQQQQQQQQQATTCSLLANGGRRNSNSSLNSIASTAPSASGGSSVASVSLARMPARPALKQKKSVHFSDRIEMVACAEEQCEDHLPNPLLARVLAAGRQRSS